MIAAVEEYYAPAIDMGGSNEETSFPGFSPGEYDRGLDQVAGTHCFLSPVAHDKLYFTKRFLILHVNVLEHQNSLFRFTLSFQFDMGHESKTKDEENDHCDICSGNQRWKQTMVCHN